MKKILKKSVRKAQGGTEEPRMASGIGRTFNKKAIRKAISEGNPKNPPLVETISIRSKYGPKPQVTRSIDTTGYSAGKTEFPVISRRANAPNSRGTATLGGRGYVEKVIKNPNRVVYGSPHKNGGSVKKSSVSKHVGSAKKSIGNRSMKKK